jgi:hypothetical protein
MSFIGDHVRISISSRSKNIFVQSIPSTPKVQVCCRLVAGIAGSNPARGMGVCLIMCLYVVLSCVGRGLCDGLITLPEESYRVSNSV